MPDQDLENYVQNLMSQEEFRALTEEEQEEYLNQVKMNHYREQMELFHQQQIPMMGEEEFEMIEQQQNPQFYPGYHH